MGAAARTPGVQFEFPSSLGSRLTYHRQDVDPFSAACGKVKSDLSIRCRKQRVIPSAGHIEPGMDTSPVLTHENASRLHPLTPVPLHPQPLTVAVSPVAARSGTLLVSHPDLPF